jgi:hypothetical protein
MGHLLMVHIWTRLRDKEMINHETKGENEVDHEKGEVLVKERADHHVRLTEKEREAEVGTEKKKRRKKRRKKRNLHLLLVGSEEGRVFGTKHQLDLMRFH